jgi:hypothetical protein
MRDYVSVSLVVQAYSANPAMVLDAIKSDTLQDMISRTFETGYRCTIFCRQRVTSSDHSYPGIMIATSSFGYNCSGLV